MLILAALLEHLSGFEVDQMNLATGKARHGLEGVGVFAWGLMSEEALHLGSGDRTAKEKRHCTVDVTRFGR